MNYMDELGIELQAIKTQATLENFKEAYERLTSAISTAYNHIEFTTNDSDIDFWHCFGVAFDEFPIDDEGEFINDDPVTDANKTEEITTRTLLRKSELDSDKYGEGVTEQITRQKAEDDERGRIDQLMDEQRERSTMPEYTEW